MSNIQNNQNFINLPTCSAVPSSGSQLINKTYGDGTYGLIAAANAWTNTNTFNTNLPTSTVTPTTGTQLITKTYGDTTYGILTAANIWSGSASTFNNNPLFPTGAIAGFLATCTAGTGSWTWQAAPAGFSTSTVTTSSNTATTLVTIGTTTPGVTSVYAYIAGANAAYSDATGGFVNVTALNNGTVTTIVGTAYIGVTATSTGTISATISGNNILIQVTGLASTTYNWKASYTSISD